MFNRFRSPYETTIVENRFKTNADWEPQFVNRGKVFGKHSIPIGQLSNVKHSEETDHSSKIETALPHFRKDALFKSERKHLLAQIPRWQFSNKQSSIVIFLQSET
jgi:hypothetical protein